MLNLSHRLHNVTNLLLSTLCLRVARHPPHSPRVPPTTPVKLAMFYACTVWVKGPMNAKVLQLPRTSRTKLFLSSLWCISTHFMRATRLIDSLCTAALASDLTMFTTVLQIVLMKYLTFFVVVVCSISLSTVIIPTVRKTSSPFVNIKYPFYKNYS